MISLLGQYSLPSKAMLSVANRSALAQIIAVCLLISGIDLMTVERGQLEQYGPNPEGGWVPLKTES